MLLEHWNFPTTTCAVIRSQLVSDVALEQLSLLGSLQFTRRLLALTGAAFEKEGGCFPDADPYVRTAGLTADGVAQLLAVCREDFRRIVESVDVN